MTRIVAGSARGRRLSVPATGTRPTSERAREALFDSLNSQLDFEATRWLDLFAGSGAVGLEALSRGAQLAVFVESDRSVATVLATNAAALGFGRARISRMTATAYLAGPAPADPFDVVFADPPYSMADSELGALLAPIAHTAWLAPDGFLVLERPQNTGEPAWPDGIAAVKQRRYGRACLWYGRR